MRHYGKGLVSILLAIVLVLTAVPILAIGKPKTVTAMHVVDFTDDSRDHATKFEYSDDYFTGNGYQYRDDLAKVSLGMNYAAGSSQDAKIKGDIKNEDQNWKSFMKQMDFKDIESNEWMKELPQSDSIGVCAAQKTIKDKKGKATLIAIGVRGSNYRGEWGGNARLDKTGNHKGFDLCKDQTLDYMKQYIAENGIKGRIKVWISGYSRAAATSNLVGGALDDGYVLNKNVTFAPEDLYCYCFETPKGATKEEVQDKKYDNIHNIVNPSDVVTYVGMKDWDFARYGVDHLIPAIGDPGYEDMDAKMIARLSTIYNDIGNKNPADSIEASKPIPELYDTFLTLACNAVGSREEYVDKFREPVVKAMYTYFAAEDHGGQNAFTNHLEAAISNHATEIFNAALNPTKSAVDTAIEAVLSDLRKENMTTLTLEEVKSVLKDAIIPMAVKMVAEDPTTTFELLKNASLIGQCHSQCLTESWLFTLPDGYMASHTAYSYQY